MSVFSFVDIGCKGLVRGLAELSVMEHLLARLESECLSASGLQDFGGETGAYSSLLLSMTSEL